MSLKKAMQAMLLLAIGFLAGLWRGSETAPTAPSETVAPSGFLSENEVEELVNLGYVDRSPVKADPTRQGVTFHARDKTSPGLTLITHHKPCIAHLVNMQGESIRSWASENCAYWTRAVILASGDVLVVEGKGFLSRFDWGGQLLWRKKLNSHHDVEPRSADTFALLTTGQRHIEGEGPPIVDNFISIVSADGEILSSLSVYEVLTKDPSGLPLILNRNRDIFHSNSIEWMKWPHLARKNPIYGLNNVLVSVRNQNMLAIINWAEHEVVWQWGPGTLRHQHEASVLKNGNILVFDNRPRRGVSRILEVNPLTNEIVWEYSGDDPAEFFSKSRGTVQALPNDNLLIAVSNIGRVIEITHEGELVWEYWNPVLLEGRRVPVRAERYSSNFIDGLHADE